MILDIFFMKKYDHPMKFLSLFHEEKKTGRIDFTY